MRIDGKTLPNNPMKAYQQGKLMGTKLARKYARRKPLSGMALRTAPRIKCKKNRLKTDYTKHPFGPKHRKESSL